MASSWLVTRTTAAGVKRYEVRFRLGGRESTARYAGSFKTKAEGLARQRYVALELAALRVPDIAALKREPERARTLLDAAAAWQGSRIDVAKATRVRHGLEVDRIGKQLGTRRVDAITAGDVVDFVAALVADDYSRGTIRKTLQTLQMVLDHAEVVPNPARDRRVKLPREEPEELNPPTAEHVVTVYRLLPSKHRLSLLWLDWSGARVSSIDSTLVGDYDEPRRRVRLRAATTKTGKALWVELHPVLADAIEARLGPREDRDPGARLFADSGADALRTSIAKACKAAGIPAVLAARPAPPANLAVAFARYSVGSHRRARRPAQPQRHRRHIYARSLGRDGTRLRRASKRV